MFHIMWTVYRFATGRLCAFGLSIVMLVTIYPHNVQSNTALEPLIIRNDRGGFVRSRLISLRELRANGRNVEIRGNVCFSACTLYLGLPQTCISKDTMFGFHGPSMMGIPINSTDFENVTRIISSQYPQPLQDWYMREGRNRINGMFRVRGAELVKMGIRECLVT